jgi:hypothetical protein
MVLDHNAEGIVDWDSLRQHIQRTYRVTDDERVTYPTMDWHGLRFIVGPSSADARFVHADTRSGRGREYVVVAAGIGMIDQLNFVEMIEFISTKLLERVIKTRDGELIVQETVPIDQVDGAVLDNMIENVLTWARVLEQSYPRR